MHESHERPVYRVLTTRTIVLSSTALIVVAAGVAWWLLFTYGAGTDADRMRLDAIRTAGTIVVGTGGIAALWLAARRQQTAEIALRQKDIEEHRHERVAAAVEMDAAERRVTELYTKSVEQLGSDKAPVRLGGMYALERLAQNTPDQRQTIVNVLCAYLRMPYTPLTETIQSPNQDPERVEQEQQVRLTAQRILSTHLHAPNRESTPRSTFWSDIDLDLTSATLMNFNLAGCKLRRASFQGCKFFGETTFSFVHFSSAARFDDADFHKGAMFESANFDGQTIFDGATFNEHAEFIQSNFGDGASFDSATFQRAAGFDEVTFTGTVTFNNARHVGFADFRSTHFNGNASLQKVQYEGDSSFDRANFRSITSFSGSKFNGTTRFTNARFNKSVGFSDGNFAGPTDFNKAIFVKSARFEKSTFSGDADYTQVKFMEGARFDGAKFTFDQMPSVARFTLTEFHATVRFSGARFDTMPVFKDALFKEDVGFDWAHTPFHKTSRALWPGGYTVVEAKDARPTGTSGAWGYLVRLDTPQGPQ